MCQRVQRKDAYHGYETSGFYKRRASFFLCCCVCNKIERVISPNKIRIQLKSCNVCMC
ncbi:hypothetical protein HID58_094848 [Brassica napus]|uniref:Uncharacterized protein n=1 Tax=Brassica napus TaxID=3708 RepID=A0ABQ7X5V2_BRANA|nr:hypothetical protein HID58_094848 [Brassica napus]